MFSKWFSGNNCAQYRTSPHKQRIDQVGRNLVEQQYANEVIRHHLHEWLRFTFYLNAQGHLILPSPSADSVRQFVSQRTLGKSASHSRFIRASLRIFLEADDQG